MHNAIRNAICLQRAMIYLIYIDLRTLNYLVIAKVCDLKLI